VKKKNVLLLTFLGRSEKERERERERREGKGLSNKAFFLPKI
jgi:hypothetical protein